MEKRHFTSHPYSQENNGEYSQDNYDPNSKKSQITISNILSIHDENLFANKTDINYRFLPILGVQASYLQFYEDDPFDDLNMTSALLNFYRIREDYVTGYWGIGVTHVGSDVQLTGFAYNVGLDAFWGKQISTEMYWKQSYLNKTPLNELKFMLNYHINRTVLSAGLVNHNLAGSNFAMLGAGLKVYLH